MRGAIAAGAVAIGCVLGGTAAWAGEVATFASVKARAAQEKKLLLLEFGAEWCGPCQRFARDASSDARLRAGLERFVLHSIDAEKGEGVALAKSFGVEGYPTFVLTDATGAPIDRWSSYRGASEFIAALDDAAADPTTVEAKRARFEKTPTAADAARLGRIAAATKQLDAAIALYRRAQSLDPTPSAKYAYPVFEAYAMGYFKGGVFKAEEVDAAGRGVLAVGDATPLQQAELAAMMSGIGERTKDRRLAVPYLKAAVPATAGSTDPAVLELRRELLVDHALLVESDAAKAMRFKRDTMPEGWMQDPVAINQFAWWCFQNQVGLEEAEALARQGIALSKPGNQKAMLLDTAAEICNLRGSCRDAVALMEQALQEDPKNEYYAKQRERFQKRLAAPE